MASTEIKINVDTSELKLSLLDAEIELANARVNAAMVARESLKVSRRKLEQDSGIPTIRVEA